ncbi:MAG: hypothetical protein K6G38_06305 [Gammaproteobacteria bacterium]|nr:hypothetical protein [Gammaproteobacteria bacterium]
MALYIDKNVYVGDTGKQLKDIKTNADNIPTNQEIIDLIYPVGSVYLTLNKVNPSTFLGGTWEQVYGGYLYFAQSTLEQTSFSGWNTQSTTLTVQQIPRHEHLERARTSDGNWNGIATSNSGGSTGGAYPNTAGWTNNGRGYGYTEGTGGGQGHNHAIATVDLFCYKRTA